MQKETGTLAGAIWQALSTKGEVTLRKLKAEIEAPEPMFDWAIGWLAREDKIVITRKQRTFYVRLKESNGVPASAS